MIRNQFFLRSVKYSLQQRHCQIAKCEMPKMQMVGLGPDHQGLSLVPTQGQVVNDKDFDCKENEKINGASE